MKKILLSVIALVGTMSTFAQNALVASLSHGTNVQMFYGNTALQEAVNVAESGDIINLSSGTFLSADIKKAITLRGVGIVGDNPTYILNNFTIEIPTEDANRFMMEGIRCQGTMFTKGTFANPYFVKCQFKAVQNASESDAVTNKMFVNCKIVGNTNVGANDSYYFVNSFVTGIAHYQNASLTAVNCVLNTGVYGLTQSDFYNCIFYTTRYTESKLPTGTKATNCYFVEYDGDSYAYTPFNDECVNCGRFKYTEMFKTFTGRNYTDAETFELTDEAKAIYLGTDGKEIGLYGGLQPYNLKPSYPLISTMTVGEQTDANGQLNVTIEVE